MSASVPALSMRATGTADVDPARSQWRVEVAERDSLRLLPFWQVAFAAERKDHRYYELIEDTLHPEFDYRYFVIRDESGKAQGVQPFFLADQDILVGLGSRFRPLIGALRKVWPRFMRA